jgi:DNA-binding PadR family transcriptional regulator
MAPRPPLGEFEVTVLLSVLQLAGDATGTGVRDEIHARTGRPLARGAVYVTLDRLEEKHLVVSRFDEASPARGGHPKRFFRVTPAGLRELRHSLSMLARMQAGLESVLKPAKDEA